MLFSGRHFLVSPAGSRATYLLTMVSVCLLVCLLACLLACGQLFQILKLDGSLGSTKNIFGNINFKFKKLKILLSITYHLT